jgi:hypothetical protein
MKLAALPITGFLTGYDVGRTAKAGYEAYKSHREAETEKKASEAKYGTVEAATRTRKDFQKKIAARRARERSRESQNIARKQGILK